MSSIELKKREKKFYMKTFLDSHNEQLFTSSFCEALSVYILFWIEKLFAHEVEYYRSENLAWHIDTNFHFSRELHVF
jgi:hypothetical protein